MKHREPKDMEEAICDKGIALFKGISRAAKEYNGISIKQFFEKDHKKIVPRTVILQGHSGYGKSFTAQKILHAWASGEMYGCFLLVFLLKVKELNKIEGKHSLVDLLQCKDRDRDTLIKLLEKRPDKVLFIIDGFDELRLSTEDTKTSRPSNQGAKGKVKEVLEALLRGEILQDSSLLVTTRSTALKALSDVLKGPQRFTEILGFSEDGLKTYFKAFFQGSKDPHRWEKALNHVKENDTLLTACFIPLTCWVVGTILDDVFSKNSGTPSGLDTNTSIFARFVYMQKKYHSQVQGESNWNDILKNVGEIAYDGIIASDTIKVFFDDSYVKQKIQNPNDIPFLCEFFLRNLEVESQYRFMHLSFQEFFTALFYILIDSEKAQKKVKEVLQRVQQKHHVTDQKQHMSHVLPVIQFLFGLLNKKVTLIHQLSVSRKIHSLLKKWIHNLIKDEEGLARTYNIQLFILQCLYEVHDEGFVRKAMKNWNRLNLDGIPLKLTDCKVLAYCMKHCQTMKRLILTHCNLTPEKLRVLTDAMAKSSELG